MAPNDRPRSPQGMNPNDNPHDLRALDWLACHALNGLLAAQTAGSSPTYVIQFAPQFAAAAYAVAREMVRESQRAAAEEQRDEL